MRASGILMPVFSLPGPFGIGTLGAEAFAFVDFLARARQTYWQILPIGPTGYGDSPYQSFSAFAGNPYFIDYRVLAEDGWLTLDEVPAPVPVGTVDYGALYNERPAILKRAADRLLAEPSKAYTDFCAAQDFWLDDYALFMALKAEQGQAGLADWPDALRTREPSALAAARVRLADAVDYHKAVQFFFFTQWSALKTYANQKGIQLVGDIPIYVSPDSSDLWTRPELFQTDGQVHLTQVAGCPPDAFAADGQLWGNPLYDWPRHEAEHFAWWKRRMKHATSIYDVVRIDHFRGFESYYSIPAGNTTAAGGRWVKGPDRAFIDAMHEALGQRHHCRGSGLPDPGGQDHAGRQRLPRHEDHAVRVRQPGAGQLPALHLHPEQRRLHRHPRQRDHRRLAGDCQPGGCPLRLPVSALHPQRPDRSHDRGLPFLRVGYGHHPDGGLAPPRCRSPHQHPQHAGLQLAVASDHASDEPAGGPHRRSDDPV